MRDLGTWISHGLAMSVLTLPLAACQAVGGKPETTGVNMTGIDQLDEHLSVQDFRVDGRGGFQAGKGGSVVCCARVPVKWYPGAKVHVTWNVTNWRDRTSEERSADVLLDRYEGEGRMYVHFLPDGSVRIVLSNDMPWADAYQGPKGIPQKEPWKRYPWPSSIETAPSPFRPASQVNAL